MTELRGTIMCEEDERLQNVKVWLHYPSEYYEKTSFETNSFVAAILLSAMRMGIATANSMIGSDTASRPDQPNEVA